MYNGIRKYILTFRVSDNLMGIDVGTISHVLRKTTITPLPESADYVEGVIVYRDHVVPIINLQTKFRKTPVNSRKRIILVNSDNLLIGFLVDDILDVLAADQEKIKTDSTDQLIHGTITHQDQIIVIVDPDRILDENEQKLLRNIY